MLYLYVRVKNPERALNHYICGSLCNQIISFFFVHTVFVDYYANYIKQVLKFSVEDCISHGPVKRQASLSNLNRSQYKELLAVFADPSHAAFASV